MSTIAQLVVPAEEFALRETMSRVPGVNVEAERVVAHGRDRVMPFVWASGEDLDEFEDALAADPTVENERRLTEVSDGRFYQMEWVESVEVLLHSMTEYGAAVLKAHGRDDRWYLRIVFPHRDAFSQTHDFCREQGLPIEVEQIHELDEHGGRGQFGLTSEQYDAVTAAFEMGYYEVPRRTSARDLSDELEISHQALSERLRRGHGNLVANALRVGEDDEHDGERPRAANR